VKAVKHLFAIVVFGAVAFIPVACTQALALHDRITGREVSATVARELTIGASLDDMRTFLLRHTTRFALDDRFHHVYAGFLPQSPWDKRLFDRQVEVNLYLDENRRFRNAGVEIYYTFL